MPPPTRAHDRARRNRRLSHLTGAVLVAAIVVAVVVVVTGGGRELPRKQPGEAVAGQTAVATQLRGIPQHGDVLGDPNAPVTLLEYADPQCPACRAYALEVLPTLVRDYVRTGRLRMELRAIPIIDEDSPKAIAMVEAAGLQDRLWNYLALFYVNQGPEHGGYVTDAFLRRIGRGVPGLDVDRALRDRTSPAVRRRMTAARSAGVRSTPTFLIGPTNGTLKPFRPTRPGVGQFEDAIAAA